MVDGMYQAADRVLTSISVGSSVVTGECERTEQVESGNNIPMSATAGHLLLLLLLLLTSSSYLHFLCRQL